MPLSNVYISNHNIPYITDGATTGNFGQWEDTGIEWVNGNFWFAGDPNILQNGVSAIHTGGLQRAYKIELTPVVPAGVTYPVDGWMSFCTLDLKISGHWGSLKDPTQEWFTFDEDLIGYIPGSDGYYTHQYNPLWQTEYDPYHGITPIQSVNGGEIIGPWNMPANQPYYDLNTGWQGYAPKIWYQGSVEAYGDQPSTQMVNWNPAELAYNGAIGQSQWCCDENDISVDCDPSSTPNVLMHGKAVAPGQDAPSLWDNRVSHVIAFNTQPLHFLGLSAPSPRGTCYNNLSLNATHGITPGYSYNKRIGAPGNKVIVIVVLKPNVYWNQGNLDLFSDIINVDFDGNAFFIGDNHLVQEPGDPISDEEIDVILGTVPDVPSEATPDNDGGADEEFDPNDNLDDGDGLGTAGGDAGVLVP